MPRSYTKTENIQLYFYSFLRSKLIQQINLFYLLRQIDYQQIEIILHDIRLLLWIPLSSSSASLIDLLQRTMLHVPLLEFMILNVQIRLLRNFHA